MVIVKTRVVEETMTSPLADEEELLRLVTEGLSQTKIAERKGVTREAVRQRLVALRPEMERRGIEIHSDRGIRRNMWVPWRLGTTRWRYHYTTKMLKLLGRTYDGPPLTESEQRQLDRFTQEMDSLPKLTTGRGVVTYRGPDIGMRVVARLPWDRGYVRWPDAVPDTRPLPPELVLPDEPYTDPAELEIWKLTELPKEERHKLIVEHRERKAKRKNPSRRKAAG